MLETLWPELPPDAALNELYKALHALRRVLEPDLQRGSSSSYVRVANEVIALAPELIGEIDVVRFEHARTFESKGDHRTRLRTAIEQYGGDFLADDPYSEWPVSRREMLRSSWQQAVLDLAELDLAALAVRPSDLDTPGFARNTGQTCSNAAGCADSILYYSGPDAETVANAKVRRGYLAGLTQPELINAGTQSDWVETTILEFADSAKAKAGLGTVLQNLSNLAEPAANDTVSGAELIVVSGSLNENDGLAGATGLRFRIGRLVVGISYGYVPGHDIDSAVVESLARIVAERFENPLPETTLGPLIVHHIQQSYEAYDVIDGEIQQTFSGFGTTNDARAEEYKAAGATEVFLSSQTIAASNPIYPELMVTISLLSFEDDQSASDFIHTSYAAASVPNQVLLTAEETPRYGDESLGVVFSTDNVDALVLVARVDSTVFAISWQNWFPTHASSDPFASAQANLMPLAVFTAEAQTACIEAGSCAGFAAIPADLIPQV